jgi:hypothetical protein
MYEDFRKGMKSGLRLLLPFTFGAVLGLKSLPNPNLNLNIQSAYHTTEPNNPQKHYLFIEYNFGQKKLLISEDGTDYRSINDALPQEPNQIKYDY